MKKIYYEKVGRRYRPVSEYDTDLMCSLPNGAHLFMVYPGGSSMCYKINPDSAALLAAARVASAPMAEAIQRATEMHRKDFDNTPLTPEQHRAWTEFVQVMGERGRYVQYKSAYDIAQAGIDALVNEAQELMKHPAVRDAYERFQTVCELTKQQVDNS